MLLLSCSFKANESSQTLNKSLGFLNHFFTHSSWLSTLTTPWLQSICLKSPTPCANEGQGCCQGESKLREAWEVAKEQKD